jgi:hypothetical protein
MTLFDELNAVEGGWNGVNRWTVEDEVDNVECVSDEFVSERRWTTLHTAVFKRGDEYVALDYESPATEMHEGGDFDHEFYVVRPVEVTVTKYEKV